MEAATTLAYDAPALARHLDALDDAEFDALDFGVIAIDAQAICRRYNAYESNAAGLSPERVLGLPLFTVVAPCMNNYLVAQRFDDAAAAAGALDAVVDYVLTLRMRPVQVKLRLLAEPGQVHRYVVVQRALSL